LVGCDLIEIERLKTAMQRTPRLRERVFTPGEIAYCEARSNPYPSYAVRFAAKEAFRKLHPFFVTVAKFHEVEVITGAGGRSRLRLQGATSEKARELGIQTMDISLSHSREYAMAVACAFSSIDREEGWE
jgi:holo-[acyl-carrier protein] synthase